MTIFRTVKNRTSYPGIFLIFLLLLMLCACTDDSTEECTGSEWPCGNTCPETIDWQQVTLEADGSGCRIPDTVSDDQAYSTLGEILNGMGLYRDVDGHTIRLACDTDHEAIIPLGDDGSTIAAGCAMWMLPVVYEKDGETVFGGAYVETSYPAMATVYLREGYPTIPTSSRDALNAGLANLADAVYLLTQNSSQCLGTDGAMTQCKTWTLVTEADNEKTYYTLQ